ncbi:MAG TPA: DUF4386 domain-containing protein [Streptosporangiaceae bacterium]|jgi:hypothetical protein
MTESVEPAAPTAPRARQGGPPLALPAIAYGVFVVASAAIGAGGTRPDMSAAQVLAYDLGHVTLLKVLATVVFAAALPLVIWAATGYQWLRDRGISAPGTVMALSGGILAAAALASSALATWSAADSASAAAPALAHALTGFAFAAGGSGFVVPFALMVAGVAVPSLIRRLLPRWMSIAGLVIAAVGMVATLALLTPALYPLLPIVRFGGLIWLLVASFLLPRRG